ncbi:hypothetical protein F0562_031500 [Nyssa sinensis]|uniref:PAP/OAS1 substrate-binding-related domain-containing protein n=1 Tax=Nyssa sinensis TaxID=561372 RepID=A0A5J5ASP4_9ASTE|nr:hypothetical protein F0562_031500 [Nyssa sinensis]
MGLPAVFWCGEVFGVVANRCGEFIAVDEATAGRAHLRWARILVRAAFGSIPATVKISLGSWRCEVPIWVGWGPQIAKNVVAGGENRASSMAEISVAGTNGIHMRRACEQGEEMNVLERLAGRLCALSFLEQVDQLIGKDHLFKRSIILIKAWCYYESRILGAHHGLISTYALETLVLYIINLFHSTLHGPLAVLCRFLNYYSTFDWDKYCISLNGPVAISSLPEIVVETPEIDGNEFLLSEEFLKNSTEVFSASTRALDTNGQAFSVKHLNIIDPLKENNNLGRSVSKGNFHRIRCAFSYGARKLGGILSLPRERIAEGLKRFFITTLDHNGRGLRSDVQVPVMVYSTGRSEVSDLSGDHDRGFTGLQNDQWYHNYTLAIPVQHSLPTLPSQVWYMGAQMQLKRNFFSTRNANDFIPQSFCHPFPFQLSSSSLSVKETMKFRGTGTYIPEVNVEEKLKLQGAETYNFDLGVEEKLKSRGTGPFFPDMCVEKLMLQGTGRYMLDMGVEEKVKLRGRGTFICDVGVEEKFKSQGSCSYIPDLVVEENIESAGPSTRIPAMGVEEKAKSQGTGMYTPDMDVEEWAKSLGIATYSPDWTKYAYWQMHVWGNGRKAEPRVQGSLPTSPLNTEKVEVSSETDKGKSSSSFDLSLEEFPLLPSSSKKAIAFATPQSGHPTVFPQPQESSPGSESIEFGTFGPSSSSVTMDSMPKQGPPVSSESDEEKVMAKPFQLDDDEDFPPLSM